MKKIKINTVAGATLEKPLITAFKGNSGNYVVLDNEMNGSMGLPIILVCKLEGNKLIKINDQNEWTAVKENLKSIIAGGQMEYLKIDDIMAADEIFYTQLTLPVISFDTLKNNYKIEENGNVNNTASIFDINPAPINEGMAPLNNVVNNTQPTPGINPNFNINREMQNAPINNIPEPSIQTPMMDLELNNADSILKEPSPINNGASIQPQGRIEASTVDVVPHLEEQINNIVNGPIPSNPQVTPILNPTPINPSTPISNIGLSNDLFKDQKEAFMQACENMFDALVQKFEKELEKR